MSLKRTCDICGETDNLKTTKIGLIVCSECVKPIAETHRVFGGKVEKLKKQTGERQ